MREVETRENSRNQALVRNADADRYQCTEPLDVWVGREVEKWLILGKGGGEGIGSQRVGGDGGQDRLVDRTGREAGGRPSVGRNDNLGLRIRRGEDHARATTRFEDPSQVRRRLIGETAAGVELGGELSDCTTGTETQPLTRTQELIGPEGGQRSLQKVKHD